MISHKEMAIQSNYHDTAAAREESASLFLHVAAAATPGIVSDDQEAGGSTNHSGFQFSEELFGVACQEMETFLFLLGHR